MAMAAGNSTACAKMVPTSLLNEIQTIVRRKRSSDSLSTHTRCYLLEVDRA